MKSESMSKRYVVFCKNCRQKATYYTREANLSKEEVEKLTFTCNECFSENKKKEKETEKEKRAGGGQTKLFI